MNIDVSYTDDSVCICIPTVGEAIAEPAYVRQAVYEIVWHTNADMPWPRITDAMVMGLVDVLDKIYIAGRRSVLKSLANRVEAELLEEEHGS